MGQPTQQFSETENELDTTLSTFVYGADVNASTFV
jgi:hypothetical protein